MNLRVPQNAAANFLLSWRTIIF